MNYLLPLPKAHEKQNLRPVCSTSPPNNIPLIRICQSAATVLNIFILS